MSTTATRPKARPGRSPRGRDRARRRRADGHRPRPRDRFYTEVIGLTGPQPQRERRRAGRRRRGPRDAARGARGWRTRGPPAGRSARRRVATAGLYHFALLFPAPRGARPRRAPSRRGTRRPIDGAIRPRHPRGDLPPGPRRHRHRARGRPAARGWPDAARRVSLAGGPTPLDVPDLFATIAGEPPGARRTGAAHGARPPPRRRLDASTRFYRDGLGFEVMARDAAARYSSQRGGYHHHVGFNLWRGAARRRRRRARAAPLDPPRPPTRPSAMRSRRDSRRSRRRSSTTAASTRATPPGSRSQSASAAGDRRRRRRRPGRAGRERRRRWLLAAHRLERRARRRRSRRGIGREARRTVAEAERARAPRRRC